MERVLVVEDDQRLAQHVCGLVLTAGLAPHHVSHLNELDSFIENRPALQAIVLDRLLGGIDTKSRVSKIKEKWPTVPILVLSAINTPLERAELLELGADDYLGKPFLAQEFLARLRALTRRYSGVHSNYRKVGDLVLDIPKRILMKGDSQQYLPSKEFLILKLLSEEAGRVLNKNELLDTIWNGAHDVETNVVESTVTNLRRRISNLHSSVRVMNSRNVGYWLEE